MKNGHKIYLVGEKRVLLFLRRCLRDTRRFFFLSLGLYFSAHFFYLENLGVIKTPKNEVSRLSENIESSLSLSCFSTNSIAQKHAFLNICSVFFETGFSRVYIHFGSGRAQLVVHLVL